MHPTMPFIGEWFEQDYKENIFLEHVIFRPDAAFLNDDNNMC